MVLYKKNFNRIFYNIQNHIGTLFGEAFEINITHNGANLKYDSIQKPKSLF